MTDNFNVYGGYIHQPGIADRAIVGGEALVSQRGVSLFGEGRIGSSQWSALAGIRLYTGKSKTLIDRHRKDDPIDHFEIVVDAFNAYKAATGSSSEGSPTTYVLSVTREGLGAEGGLVTSSPAGISCGATCNASYTSGTMVTLTASATPGYAFDGWSGACTGMSATCIVNITAATSVTAAFRIGSEHG